MEVDNNQLRTSKVAEELSVNCSMVVWHLKQIGKAKKLSKWNKWVPHELTEKKCCFEVLSSLCLCNNKELFLYQIVTRNQK